jgi:hypothetical protein
MGLEPVSVVLKFGFLGILYLFLLWVSRSALKDLRRTSMSAGPHSQADFEATGFHAVGGAEPRLVVERAPGHRPGMEYDLGAGAVLGRGDRAEIQLDDPFASSRHARIGRQGAVMVLEDLGSTNGTYLDRAKVSAPTPVPLGVPIRIGRTSFELRS